MEPIVYGYSKFVVWSGIIMFSAMMIFFVAMGFMTNKAEAWLYILIPIAILATILFFFIRSCFIPLLNNELTLELDEENCNVTLTDLPSIGRM